MGAFEGSARRDYCWSAVGAARPPSSGSSSGANVIRTLMEHSALRTRTWANVGATGVELCRDADCKGPGPAGRLEALKIGFLASIFAGGTSSFERPFRDDIPSDFAPELWTFLSAPRSMSSDNPVEMIPGSL